jgi:lactate permease
MTDAQLLSAARAALPIAVILALMLWRRWSATQAGGAGLAVCVVVVVAHFGMPTTTLVGVPAGAALTAGVVSEALFFALSIVWILWPALALHEHQERIRAIAVLRGRLLALAPDPSMRLLLLAWFAALFFEGAAGFGTPVALCAPLLVGVGVAPVTAVTVALLGHAVGVSFGAVGTPLLTQVALTQTPVAALAFRTATLHAVLGVVLMGAVVRALRAGGARVSLAPAMLAAACFLVPSVALAAVVSAELVTLGAAMIGAAAFLVVGRRLWPAAAVVVDAGAAAGPNDGRPSVGAALIPYGMLVVLIVVTRLVPPVADALGAVWSFRFDERYHASLKPLLHPGTLLMASLLLSAPLRGRTTAEVAAALGHAARRLAPAAIALTVMLTLSRLMVHAGLVDALQAAVVLVLGRAFVVACPLIGALGSFVTGSATSSNVLFSALQAQAATSIGVEPGWLIAGQGVGAAVGNIICPHNVIAGVATVGLAGQEALVLRQTVGPCLLYSTLAGLLLAAIVLL